MPRLQSTYRRHHSTETALVKVLSDIYAGVDEQQVTLLGLLDLSAALDCMAFCYSDCAQGSASREQYLAGSLHSCKTEHSKCSTSSAYQKYFSYSLEYHRGLF